MPKNTWKGSTLLAPLPPALVSCNTVEDPKVLTVAWTGIVNSQPPKTYVSIRPERNSHAIIKNRGEFVINLPTQALVRVVDLCGVLSGRDTDKFTLCHLTAQACEGLSAPAIAECPMSLTCRVTDVVSMGSHDMFLADIIGVMVDDELIDSSGKLHLERAHLLAFAHGAYYALGRRLATLGYSVRKRPKSR